MQVLTEWCLRSCTSTMPYGTSVCHSPSRQHAHDNAEQVLFIYGGILFLSCRQTDASISQTAGEFLKARARYLACIRAKYNSRRIVFEV